MKNDEKKIYKNILKIAIPVLLENLVYNFVNFIDNFMVGSENELLGLGEKAVSGLGIANQFYFIFIVSLFGMFSGASVLSAQYYGNKDYKNLSKILSLLSISSLVVSFPFLIIGILNSDYFFNFYTKDPKTLMLTLKYFKIACLTFPLSGLSFALSMQLRVINKSKYSFYSSLIGLIINFIFNSLLIPIYGVEGAAIATVFARLISLIYLYYIVKINKFPILTNIKDMLDIPFDLIKSIFIISLPTFLHEILWVVATSLKSSIFSNIGSLEFAAIVMTGTISSIAFSVFSGISNASSVLIGNKLGSNDLDKAEKISKICIKMMLVLSIILSLVLVIIGPIVLNLMNISSELEILTRKILIIESIVISARALNLLFIVGILRAGGDINFGMILDIIGMWLIALPLSFISRKINLKLEHIYFISYLSEYIILIPVLYRYRQKKWLKKII